ncbi:hypothetical protein ACHAXS_006015 [Conticribra weissflogii]
MSLGDQPIAMVAFPLKLMGYPSVQIAFTTRLDHPLRSTEAIFSSISAAMMMEPSGNRFGLRIALQNGLGRYFCLKIFFS